MVIKPLEKIEIEVVNGLKVCSLREYLRREVPGHEDKKLLSQTHCYSRCNSSCPLNPLHGDYI